MPILVVPPIASYPENLLHKKCPPERQIVYYRYVKNRRLALVAHGSLVHLLINGVVFEVYDFSEHGHHQSGGLVVVGKRNFPLSREIRKSLIESVNFIYFPKNNLEPSELLRKIKLERG